MIQRITSILVIVLTIVSCASPNPNNSDGMGFLGGGYKSRILADGKIYILARTNYSPSANYEEVREMWNMRADKACKGNSYTEEAISEYTNKSAIVFFSNPHVVTVKEAYAICNSTP